MKIRVTLEGETFEVEVGDLSARPIVATVEGATFEVWPEEPAAVPTTPPAVAAPTASPPVAAPPPRPSRRTGGEAAVASGRAGKVVFAPIPGIIDSVSAQPGDRVAAGQPLCVLEAMKMKNVIRAARAGEIAAVLVAPGQHVKHNDPLFEYV